MVAVNLLQFYAKAASCCLSLSCRVSKPAPGAMVILYAFLCHCVLPHNLISCCSQFLAIPLAFVNPVIHTLTLGLGHQLAQWLSSTLTQEPSGSLSPIA